MHPLAFALLSYAALTTLLVVIVHRVRPRWSRLRLIATGTLYGPALIVIGSVLALVAIAVDSPRDEDIDAFNHAKAAYLFFIVVGAPLAALIGGMSAWLSTRFMRARPVA